MTTFAVYADWRSDAPIEQEVVAQISRDFRPDNESVCVWVDQGNPTVLTVSVDLVATDYDEPGRVARRLAQDAAFLGSLSGRLIRVTASTEEGQAVWSEADRDLSR